MNKKHISILVCAFFAVFATWLFLDTEEEQEQTVSTPVQQEHKPQEPTWSFQTVATESHTKKTQPKDDIVFTQAVKQQMADISEAFEENMRYPTYSKPLYTNDWTLLNPRAFIPKAVPLEGLEQASAEIIIPKYIVTRDESIPVTLKIMVNGANAPQAQQATLLLGSKQLEIPLNASASEPAFTATIPPTTLKNITEKDVVLSAEIVFDDFSRANVSTIFKLVGTEAVMNSLSSAYVEGADLVIPANFSVSESGHYRIQANLFDKATLSPISHLNATFKLSSGRDSGLLKVHAETLRSKGFAGPYLLQDLNITRSPATPGDQTGYGRSEHETYEVQGFDLDSYSREAYQDKHSQQRLQFLQKMAGLEAK